MKIITKPSVYLVGKQTVSNEELDRFLSDIGVTWESDSEVAAEVLSEVSGRTCYLSFSRPRPGGNAAYLEHIKECSHGSTLEHAVFNFIFSGVSRSLTHELVRHRAGFGYSQVSQRYVDESSTDFVVPPDLQEEVAAAEDVRDSLGGYWGQPTPEWQAVHPRWGELPYFQFLGMVEAGRNWLESVEDAQMRYVSLSEYLTKKAYDQGAAAKGIQHRSAYLPNQLFTQEERTGFRKFARQAARSVLPNATETKIFVTVNGRAARHFLEQRGSKFADPEIRVLAGAVLDVLQKEAPNLFGDYVKTELSDGTFAIATPYEKV